uniref:Ankyrin repeat and sterile alpha motif domain containing 1B n=1 Tax=Cyprinus carpio TaxID=7962 RepID=A0A8C2ICI9_CYPCA
MGKEQELLEAARTGNVGLVEKLLSGKKGLLGSGSGESGGNAVGGGAQHGPAHLACMWRGVSVNCADSSGYTPLHHASLNGHRDVVLKLLQFEASTNVADSKGCFPLHLAAWRGDVDIVQILIHHGPSHSRVNEQNHEKETALHCAAQYGHSEVVRVLLQELTDPSMRNSRGETALDLAALYGRLQVVCMLLTAHPNLMSCNTRKHTPLHLAARNGHHATVRVLLEADMDVNTQTEKGSALHEAALFGKMDVVQLLLDSGIDANIRDCQGRTALDILREHPSQKSQQIASLIQGKVFPRHTHISTYFFFKANKALKTHTNDAVTGELSKLLNEIKICRDKDCSFEELCQTISSHSQSMESFGSGRLSDEERNGTLTRINKVWFVYAVIHVCKTDFTDSYTSFFPLADEAAHQKEYIERDDRRNSHVPEQFAGLLHGSSPACESPDNPYQLYGKVRKFSVPEPPLRHGNFLRAPEYSPPFPRTGSEASALKTQKEPKPQIVYRTIFHTRVNQGPLTLTELGDKSIGVHVRNGEVRSKSTGGSSPASSNTSYEERACTLGRMRSMPKNVLDLQLSRNFSKSDSNLVAVSPIEEEQWSSRGQNSPGKSSPNRLERTPSFTAEWEEIDKIMSSIGAGIGTELEGITEDHSGPRCPVQSVGQWLDNIGLVQYENHLLSNGFDNVQFMGSNVVEDQDLLEIGILNSAHRQRLLQAIRLLPRVRPIGYDGNNPTSVAEWLESLELGDYTKSFLINGYTSMELVKKIWEIELINVLKINLIGHRKRILASLGDRLHEDPPQKPPRAISLRVSTNPPLSPTKSPLALSHLIMQADARRRRNDNYFEDVPRSKLERQMQGEWCEPITLRPPNEATSSTPVQYWQHHPEKLIFQSCDYEAYYLGSILVKELRGTESTHDACAKMRKSTEQMKKIPTIVLSVSYKGVKFIDATNKNIIAEHEIRNISCAAQDPEDLSTFAYITKDLKSSHHYCHVFTAFDVNLAYEIILTLGQAFEVAYQLALQARKSGHGSSTLPESFDSKPSKPVPKPRVNIRKSVSDFALSALTHTHKHTYTDVSL